MFASAKSAVLSLLGRPAADGNKPLPMRPMRAANVAQGYRDPGNRPGMKRVVVTVDDATFKRIRAQAVRSKVSFAAKVRELIQRGFDAAPNDGE